MKVVSHRRGSRLAWLLVACALAATALLAGLPRGALARSSEVVGVDIDAAVRTDGSLAVVERRTYDFSGSFNGIYWDVPQGSYEGRDVVASIDAVGVVQKDGLARVEAGDAGAAGTYELSEEDDCLRIKLYWPAEDEQVTFEVSYELTSAALRWADTSELYWQYVPADEGSGQEWHDVTARVHLPVPAGASVVAGENVRAWGHGPLDGEVSFADDTVVFASPGVGSGEFLEARVAFPAKWLSEVRGADEARLEAILAEEDEWAREANAQRKRARLASYGIPGLLAFAGIGSCILAFAYKKGLLRRRRRSTFTDTYFRDVPTNDHPAVLGMLYREGELAGADYVASLMRLADQGVVRLSKVPATGRTRKGKSRKGQEYRLERNAGALKRINYSALRAGTKKIDQAALSLAFDTVAKFGTDTSARGATGEPVVVVSDFARAAKKAPVSYAGKYDTWAKEVGNAYRKRFVDKTSTEGGIFPGAIGLLDFGLFTVLGLLGAILEVPTAYLLIAMALCFAGGIACVWNSDEEEVDVLTAEGLEVRGKLEALRRWLVDFTRLEEAIPTDVVLWNRLLVMAAVLGVSREVIEQLRVALPQVLVDEELDTLAWCGVEEGGLLLVDQLSQTVMSSLATAHRGVPVSAPSSHKMTSSDYASSRDSSSEGGGGGFSGGGGGGFSGGGRGGAF